MIIASAFAVLGHMGSGLVTTNKWATVRTNNAPLTIIVNKYNKTQFPRAIRNKLRGTNHSSDDHKAPLKTVRPHTTEASTTTRPKIQKFLHASMNINLYKCMAYDIVDMR
eukprot:5626203-Amphidinium_carterae.1